MADAGLFIGFGAPARGRERLAVESFGDAIGHFAALQEAGEIDSFEPVFLEQHGGDLGGFILLRGDAEKLARVRVSEDFGNLITRASLVVDGMGVVGASLGGALQQQMAYYEEQIAKL